MIETMNRPDGLTAVARLTAHADFRIVRQHLSASDFHAQKEKQLKYPIDGASLGIITTVDHKLVLVKRTAPHKGWALPGGRVETGENFRVALVRELDEECGIALSNVRLVLIERKIFISPQYEKLSMWLGIFTANTADKPRHTHETEKEGLDVRVFSLRYLPQMVLNDKARVHTYALSRQTIRN